jgi:hypothetical protein
MAQRYLPAAESCFITSGALFIVALVILVAFVTITDSSDISFHFTLISAQRHPGTTNASGNGAPEAFAPLKCFFSVACAIELALLFRNPANTAPKRFLPGPY